MNSLVARAEFHCLEVENIWMEWCEHISPFFDLSMREETDLTNPPSMTSYHLGNVLVSEFAAPAQNLSREARKAARQGVDHVLLQFYTSGRSVVAARQEKLAVAGQVVVCDLSQPISVLSDEAVEAVNILLPRALLTSDHSSIEAQHGNVIDYRDDPLGQVAFKTLRGILDCSDRLKARHLPALGEATARLCGSFLRGAEPVRDGALQARPDMRGFIRENLSDLDLGPELLQRRFGVSRATLYREFAEEGGVQTYIRERRLAAALRLLTRPDPRGGRPRVSSVAYATGFGDEKSFSRAFKGRFGFLPRDVRSGVTPPTGGPDRGDGLLAWIRDLTPDVGRAGLSVS